MANALRGGKRSYSSKVRRSSLAHHVVICRLLTLSLFRGTAAALFPTWTPFLSKTLLGNFVEDGGAEGRDVSQGQWLANTQVMGWDGGGKPERFGAALDKLELPDPARRNPLDTGYAPPDFYTTVTQSVHTNPWEESGSGPTKNKKADFTSDFRLTGGLRTQADKEAYTDKWIKEQEFAPMRFRTQMNGVQLVKEGGIPRQ